MEKDLVKKSVTSLLNEYLQKNLSEELRKKITDKSYSAATSEEVKIVDLETLSNSLQKEIIITKLPDNNQKVVFGNLTFFYSNEKTKISFNPDTVFFGKKVTRNDIIKVLLLLLKNFGITLEFEELQKVFTNKNSPKNSNQNIIDCTNIINMLKMALENNKKYMGEGGTRRKRKTKRRTKRRTKKYNYRKKKSLKKCKTVGGNSIRKFLLILFRILFCGTIASSINFGINPTKYNGNIFIYFGLGTLCVLMTILTNNIYNIDIEIIGHYNRTNQDELDISRGSTASITTLGDDNDLEDPTEELPEELPVVPLEINLTPVNSETQENNIINDIVDIKDILLRFEEEENNNI
jgi:hypothetical protein